MLKRNSPLKRGNGTLNKGKGFKKTGNKLRAKKPSSEAVMARKAAIEQQWTMFFEIWNERGPYSEVSGIKLYGEASSMMFHHIYPKSRYKELKYVKENIIVLHPDEHQKVEGDMYCYPEVNKRREQLKQQYNL